MEYNKDIELGVVTASLEAPVIQASQSNSQKCVNDWSHINTAGGQHCTASAESWNSKTGVIYSQNSYSVFTRTLFEDKTILQTYAVANIHTSMNACACTNLALFYITWHYGSSFRVWRRVVWQISTIFWGKNSRFHPEDGIFLVQIVGTRKRISEAALNYMLETRATGEQCNRHPHPTPHLKPREF